LLIGHQVALAAAMAWTTASALWRSLSPFGTAIELNGLKNGLALLFFLPFLFTLPWTDQTWRHRRAAAERSSWHCCRG
jgi:glycopeptide antibiotics resistance protein